MTTNIHIQGTHCQACKILIEEVGGEQPEVKSIKVDLETGQTAIEHDQPLDRQKFKYVVESLGEYTVRFIEEA